jgi:hypothetical protein
MSGCRNPRPKEFAGRFRSIPDRRFPLSSNLGGNFFPSECEFTSHPRFESPTCIELHPPAIPRNSGQFMGTEERFSGTDSTLNSSSCVCKSVAYCTDPATCVHLENQMVAGGDGLFRQAPPRPAKREASFSGPPFLPHRPAAFRAIWRRRVQVRACLELNLTVRSPVDVRSPKPRNNPFTLASPHCHASQCTGVPMSSSNGLDTDSPLTARSTVRPAEAKDKHLRGCADIASCAVIGGRLARGDRIL